jgi:hypothetical protein
MTWARAFLLGLLLARRGARLESFEPLAGAPAASDLFEGVDLTWSRVRGGAAVGTTDEFGLKAVEDRISVNDFHATILHLLGLDHEKLTYRHSGRDERLTDVAGRVVDAAVA